MAAKSSCACPSPPDNVPDGRSSNRYPEPDVDEQIEGLYEHGRRMKLDRWIVK